jgi:pre-mRNA-processing factor 6
MQQYVTEHCVAAKPRHGEVWTKVSKVVENPHFPTGAILKRMMLPAKDEE